MVRTRLDPSGTTVHREAHTHTRRPVAGRLAGFLTRAVPPTDRIAGVVALPQSPLFSHLGSEMTIMITMNRARATAAAALGVLFALPAAMAQAQTQAAVITGKVTTEFGQPIDQANVYMNDLTVSVA